MVFIIVVVVVVVAKWRERIFESKCAGVFIIVVVAVALALALVPALPLGSFPGIVFYAAFLVGLFLLLRRARLEEPGKRTCVKVLIPSSRVPTVRDFISK